MAIESMIFEMIMQMFGNPLNLGIFIFIMFLGIAIIMRINESALIPIMVAVVTLVVVFIEPLRLVVALGIGLLVGIAFIKLTRG